MISEKLQTYVDTLNSMDDMMDRYTWLMDFGKKIGDRAGKVQVEGVRGPRLPVTDVAGSHTLHISGSGFYI